VGGGRGAGFPADGASDERGRSPRRLREAPALLRAQRGPDQRGGALLHPGRGLRLLLPRGATLSFADGKGRGHALGLDFLGADPHPTLAARERLSGEVNYLVGDDPAEWRQGLPTHGELLYGGLWPGIDMAVRGKGGKLKYEFHLQPGASVDDVRLAYRGADGLSVGAGGELLVQTSLGVLKDAAPVSYQLIGGERVPVQCRYTLEGEGGGYGFAVGAYDPRYPLVIDPGLAYFTFLGGTDILGGTSFDRGRDIAVLDSNAYVTGAHSPPTTPRLQVPSTLPTATVTPS
jgi:hypothetical protein